MFTITSNDLVNEVVVQRMLEVLVLHVMVQVVVKLRVIDSVYIDVSVGSGKGLLEERVMSLGISSIGRIKVLQLVTEFRDSQSLLCPVNSGVCDMKPGESKDDVFSSAAHDVEEMFLGDPFNVHI